MSLICSLKINLKLELKIKKVYKQLHLLKKESMQEDPMVFYGKQIKFQEMLNHP